MISQGKQLYVRRLLILRACSPTTALCCLAPQHLTFIQSAFCRVPRGLDSAFSHAFAAVATYGGLFLLGFHLCISPFLPAAVKYQLYTPIMWLYIFSLINNNFCYSFHQLPLEDFRGHWRGNCSSVTQWGMTKAGELLGWKGNWGTTWLLLPVWDKRNHWIWCLPLSW